MKNIVTFIRAKIIDYENKKIEVQKLNPDPVLRKKAFDQLDDNRVHCLLYFFGGGVSKVDFKLIRKIENCTNVIPVISMGDSYSKAELSDYKVKLADMAL